MLPRCSSYRIKQEKCTIRLKWNNDFSSDWLNQKRLTQILTTFSISLIRRIQKLDIYIDQEPLYLMKENMNCSCSDYLEVLPGHLTSQERNLCQTVLQSWLGNTPNYFLHIIRWSVIQYKSKGGQTYGISDFDLTKSRIGFFVVFVDSICNVNIKEYCRLYPYPTFVSLSLSMKNSSSTPRLQLKKLRICNCEWVKHLSRPSLSTKNPSRYRFWRHESFSTLIR